MTDSPAPPPTRHPHYEILDSSVACSTAIFQVRRDRCRLRSAAAERDFYVLDSVDWINVIPLTDDEHVLLVEQYRHGLDTFCLEIPGGMVDPEDPSPLHAARRELLEETGWAAPRWEHLGDMHPNPAIQSNRCSVFLAAGAGPAGPATPELWEELHPVRVPLSEIPALIDGGRITHTLVISAFYLLERWRARQGR